MTDHDAELDAMTKQLVAAGLLETFTDDDGDQDGADHNQSVLPPFLGAGCRLI